MAKRYTKRKGGRKPPREIPMTDLGWSPEGNEPTGTPADTKDPHAAGTPGGGTASGGLAGTNVNVGSPNNADLENALGSGVRDSAGEAEGGPPFRGVSGGSVGGTPAQKRAKGGRRGGKLTPGEDGDTTIGTPPPPRKR